MSKLDGIKNHMGEIALICEIHLPNTKAVQSLAAAARKKDMEAVLIAAIQLKNSTHSAKVHRFCDALIPPLVGGVLNFDNTANICKDICEN